MNYYKNYRYEIDGLRAIAVISVIFNHLNQSILPNGYLGVDIFFVISGYVITSSIISNKNKNFFKLFFDFYEKRLVRIWPLLIFLVFFMSIVICWFDPEPQSSLKTGLSSLFGISNFYLFSKATDYFSSETKLNIFTHTWSLGIESQFYLLFPFLIWLNNISSLIKRNLIYIFASIITISLLIFIYSYHIQQNFAYYLLPSRFWEITCGSIVFLILQKRKSIFEELDHRFSLIAIIGILSILISPSSTPVISTVFVVFFTSLLILTTHKKTFVYGLLTKNVCLHFGNISYSLYLWHWSILTISRFTIGVNIWTIPFLLSIIYFVSLFSFKYIEKPSKNLLLNLNKWELYSKFFFLITFSFSFIYILGTKFKSYIYLGNFKETELRTRSRINYDKRVKNKYSGLDCHYVQNTIANEILEFQNCQLNNEGSKKIFFAGNSHQDMYRTTHFKLYESLKISIDGVTNSACVFPEIKNQKGCNNLQKFQEDRILTELKAGDIVVLSNRYVLYQDEVSKHFQWLHNEESLNNLRLFSEKINKKGGKVIVFGPIPEFKVEVKECYKPWFRVSSVSKNCFAFQNDLINKRSQIYKRLNSSKNNFILYEPQKALCFNNICPIRDKKGYPLYFDTNHLTDYANDKYIYPDFLSFLKEKKLI